MEWRWRSEQQQSCSSENECESEDEGDNERRLGREGEGQRMGLRDLGIYTQAFFFFNIIYTGQVRAGYA